MLSAETLVCYASFSYNTNLGNILTDSKVRLAFNITDIGVRQFSDVYLLYLVDDLF